MCAVGRPYQVQDLDGWTDIRSRRLGPRPNSADAVFPVQRPIEGINVPAIVFSIAGRQS